MMACRRVGQIAPTRREAGGFTLMEMLVTLILISFATMLMFQMLGSYRVAQDRVRVRSGVIDRAALFQGWFRDTVQGLYIAEGVKFSGAKESFEGISLNPLYAGEGVPTQIQWELRQHDGAGWIDYSENGRLRWSRSLASGTQAHFVYLDESGRVHDTWPPARGLVALESLPAAIALSRPSEGDTLTVIAAVRGPIEPVLRTTGQME